MIGERALSMTSVSWGPTGPLIPSSSTSDSISAGFYGLVSAASSLSHLGALVLSTSDPLSKAHVSYLAFSRWRQENLPVGSVYQLPSSPARPPKPLVATNEVPNPKDSNLPLHAHMLHNLAHVELNAIDLAWDTVARFSPFFGVLGQEFMGNWLRGRRLHMDGVWCN